MPQNVVEDYGWSTPVGPHSCAYIAPRVRALLRQLTAKRVLDLGAGNGQLCSDLARDGYDVVGVEFDKEGVELSRRSYPHIRFYNYGVQDDPGVLLGQEAPFDAVVSTEVVEHLFSPHLLPQYAAAMLRDGGHLILTTPYHGYFKNVVLALLGKWDSHHGPLWHGGHVKFWSRATLSELLRQNGFEVIGFSGVGRFPYLWKSMVLVGKKL